MIKHDVYDKTEELVIIANSVISTYTSDSERVSREIIKHFCIVAPVKQEKSFDLGIIKRGGIGGGKSIKPGNLLLNWKSLLIDGAEIILTVAGSISAPWLIPFAGLVVWNKMWSLLNIEIGERHAVVLWSMWENKDNKNRIDKKRILQLTNKTLKKYNRAGMDKVEIDRIIEDLHDMGCIEKQDRNKLWLREAIKIES